MTITSISTLRRDPALANASGLIAGTTGPKGDDGVMGPAGPTGQNGAAGRGISNVAVNGAQHIIVTFTDGGFVDAGPVTVPAPTGADGGFF